MKTAISDSKPGQLDGCTRGEAAAGVEANERIRQGTVDDQALAGRCGPVLQPLVDYKGSPQETKEQATNTYCRSSDHGRVGLAAREPGNEIIRARLVGAVRFRIFFQEHLLKHGASNTSDDVGDGEWTDERKPAVGQREDHQG